MNKYFKAVLLHFLEPAYSVIEMAIFIFLLSFLKVLNEFHLVNDYVLILILIPSVTLIAMVVSFILYKLNKPISKEKFYNFFISKMDNDLSVMQEDTIEVYIENLYKKLNIKQLIQLEKIL